ncbi:MAG: glycine C-acetyltransferase [Thermoleophilaceae bacterium]|nr:glycine C-acetyltransferase [Thermoleophilaceae bacterium]
MSAPDLGSELEAIRAEGTWKTEQALQSPQNGLIELAGREGVINLCANNYLGLADHPRIVQAAHDALDRWGFGMASVRFICGTQQLHLELEERITQFLGTEATILFPSCFDANAGLFEVLLDDRDAVISDALNHASIIDGIRLCKARRLRFANRDLGELEQRLVEAGDARRRLIATDGVFSMDGYIADLPGICDLAERYDAMVLVDDSHAVGFVGPTGRGTPELHGVSDRVDLVTGTLGKALGGGSGGYVSGNAEVVSLLRQRARPYLFSNSVAPPIVAASLAALELADESGGARRSLHANAALFRTLMTDAGFDLLPGEHPIIPVMVGDAARAGELAAALLDEGVLATAFSYPVVPRGAARIRTQMSAAHSEADVRRAVDAFIAAREKLG